MYINLKKNKSSARFFLGHTQELISLFGIVLRPITNGLDLHVTYLVLILPIIAIITQI